MTRLIDADAIPWDVEGVGEIPVITKEEIDQMPTVDAEPVRHGKWIDETFKPWGLVHHPFKCNLCGECAEYASPYCPNCGARMVEDDQTN